jgi:transposase
MRRVTSDRRILTTAVGLTLSGRIYKRHFEGAMNSQDEITVFEHFRRFMPEGFILICDRLRIHTSEETIRYFWDHPEIIVEPLPKYAPKLNPEEYCHGNVKAEFGQRHACEQAVHATGFGSWFRSAATPT